MKLDKAALVERGRAAENESKPRLACETHFCPGIRHITGLNPWSSLRGRAQKGLAVLALGATVSLIVYFASVPR